MLLTAGERISMALLAMAIADLGHEARSFTGSPGRRDHRLRARQGQDHRRHAGPDRDGARRRARSRSSPASRASARTPRTSPRSAAAAPTPPRSRWPPRSSADVCEIYTDVDGVFTADPRIVPTRPQARPDLLRGDARAGRLRREDPAPALRRVRPPLRHPDPRPLVVQPDARAPGSSTRPRPREQHHGTGRSSPASRTTAARPRSPSSACPTRSARRPRIFEALADAEINIDMIVQNVSAAATGLHRHLLHAAPRPTARPRWRRSPRIQDEVGFDSLLYDDQIGKVSLIGAGMRSHPGVTAKFFAALADAGRQHRDDLHLGDPDLGDRRRGRASTRPSRATHTAFDLDADEVEAVVYGGTGPMSHRGRPTSAVVGATGQVGVVMRQILLERDFPVERDPASSPPPARPARRCRSAAREVVVEDAATADPTASTSRCSPPARRRRGRWRRGSPTPGASWSTTPRRWRMDPDVPLVVSEVNPRRDRRRPQGHHRQPELHHDGRDAGAQAAARRGRAGPAGRRRPTRPSPAPASPASRSWPARSRRPATRPASWPTTARRSRSPTPVKYARTDRLQRAAAGRLDRRRRARARPTRSRSSATSRARSSASPTCWSPASACGCRSSPATRWRSTPSSRGR